MIPPHDDLRALAQACIDVRREQGEQTDWWYDADALELTGWHVDLQLIAAANPTRITALLDEHAGLRAENDRLREAVRAAHAACYLYGMGPCTCEWCQPTPPPVATTREGR